MASWSLGLGLFSFFVCPPAGIAALITGFKAKRIIDSSAGAKAGRNNAIAGQVLGVLGIVSSLILGTAPSRSTWWPPATTFPTPG